MSKSKNKSILNKLFESKNTHKEEAPEINKEEFIKVLKSRRSVRIYNDEPVLEKDMKECLELALLAPNSSNLQPWEFYWVRNLDKKKKLVEYCLNQPAAQTAQELVVCVARHDFWKINAQRMLSIFKEKENKVPKSALTYYKKIVPLAYNQGPLGIYGIIKKIIVLFRGINTPTPREPSNTNDMKIWAHKSTALACENLMLSLRAYGYDSCPMEGIDSKRIKKLLKLPRKAQISMVISAGKRAENGVYGQQLRFNSEHFIKIV
ncbi:MAG: nitroreductase family protein [Flavobacteriales bacterium]|jgi:nitroreductase|nr:nitroreductase family protein [Flavobacteriales bacterium]